MLVYDVIDIMMTSSGSSASTKYNKGLTAAGSF